MKRTIAFIKKYWFHLAIAAILLLTIFLRFVNYSDRFGLAYDQAHDALLSHYAVTNAKLPTLGPFSSAGPFQTGGEWYWILMMGTMLAPNFLLAPWIFLTSLYVVFVGLIIKVGYRLGGKPFALIAGLLATVSTAQIMQGTNLTNQTPQALVSLLAILAGFTYVKKFQIRYLFFVGLCIGLGSSIHLSGVGLLLFALSLIIVYRKISIKGLFLLGLGIVIPWIPVFWTDYHHNFINIQNMIHYYRYDQHKISLDVLGRRWLTYAGVFWPTEWARMIGGFPLIAYFEIFTIALLFILRMGVKREIVTLALTLVLMIGLLRYTHTPLFSSYLVFTHPFVLLLTAWIGYVIFQKWKAVGIAFLAAIISCSLWVSVMEIQSLNNTTARRAEDTYNVLIEKYPNQKFAVYTYKEKYNMENYVLALYLEKSGKFDPKGQMITTVPVKAFPYQVVYQNSLNYQLLNLPVSQSAKLKKDGWRLVSGETVYVDTENWYENKR